MDEIDDDMLDEEEDSMTESWSTTKATSGGCMQRPRLGPDVGLTVEQRLTCYSDPSWRMEVSVDQLKRSYIDWYCTTSVKIVIKFRSKTIDIKDSLVQ